MVFDIKIMLDSGSPFVVRYFLQEDEDEVTMTYYGIHTLMCALCMSFPIKTQNATIRLFNGKKKIKSLLGNDLGSQGFYIRELNTIKMLEQLLLC